MTKECYRSYYWSSDGRQFNYFDPFELAADGIGVVSGTLADYPFKLGDRRINGISFIACGVAENHSRIRDRFHRFTDMRAHVQSLHPWGASAGDVRLGALVRGIQGATLTAETVARRAGAKIWQNAFGSSLLQDVHIFFEITKNS